MCEDFNKLVEQYMMMDKKTLAELLAMKELAGRLDVPVIPQYPQTPSIPINPYPWWPWAPGDGPWWPQIWYTNTGDGKKYENWAPRKTNDVYEGNAQCDYGLNRRDVIKDTTTNFS